MFGIRHLLLHTHLTDSTLLSRCVALFPLVGAGTHRHDEADQALLGHMLGYIHSFCLLFALDTLCCSSFASPIIKTGLPSTSFGLCCLSSSTIPFFSSAPLSPHTQSPTATRKARRGGAAAGPKEDRSGNHSNHVIAQSQATGAAVCPHFGGCLCFPLFPPWVVDRCVLFRPFLQVGHREPVMNRA